MNVSCGNCPAKYAVPDEKVRGRKVRITCKRCGAAIIVDGTAGDGAAASQAQPAATAKAVAAPAAASAATAAAASASVAKASTGPRPAVAVPGLGASDAPVRGRAMKRTMLGIPGPAVDAAPAPPAAREQPKREEPKPKREEPKPKRDEPKPQPAEQPSMGFAKRTMVGGIAAAPRVQAAPVPAPPPPPSPTDEWTVAVTDETHEPMTLAQVVDAFTAGRIDAETFIWKEGMPDWQMPFEIPVIENALRARGFRPSKAVAAEPAPAAGRARALSDYGREEHEKPTTVSDAPYEGGFPDAGGMWREPGRWTDASSPFGDRQGSPYQEPASSDRELPRFDDDGEGGISFDDVTVAMRAPEAEKLLREAADQSGPRMVGELDSEQKIPAGLSLDAFPPELGTSGEETIKYDKAKHPEMREFLGSAEAAPPAQDREPAKAPAPAAEPRPQARAAVRRSAEQGPVDLFSKAATAKEEPADGDGAGQDQLRMTGARNESSVLFSLDAMMKSGGAGQEPKAQKREEDVLLGGGTPATDVRFGTALAAPDFSAPVAEEPASALSVRPPTRVAEFEEEKPVSSWLWALLVLAVIGVIAALLWFLRPPWLVGALPGLFPAPVAPVVAESKPADPAPTATAAPATTAAVASVSPASDAATPKSEAPSAAARTAPAPRPGAAAPAKAPEKAPPGTAAEKPAAVAPPSDLPPFDKNGAAAALNSAAANVGSCKQAEGPIGSGRATVTFAASGRATNATISGDFAGTAVGGCVARLFRQARVAPFSGEPVTVAKSFSIQ